MRLEFIQYARAWTCAYMILLLLIIIRPNKIQPNLTFNVNFVYDTKLKNYILLV